MDKKKMDKKNIFIGFLIFIIIVISFCFGIFYSNVSGDLATCTTNLDTCNTNLSTSNTQLDTCTTNLDISNKKLATCNTNLDTCNTKLDTCNLDLVISNSRIKNNEDYFNELIKNNLEQCPISLICN